MKTSRSSIKSRNGKFEYCHWGLLCIGVDSLLNVCKFVWCIKMSEKENGWIGQLHDCFAYLFADKSLSELSFKWKDVWNALAVQVIGMIEWTWRWSTVMRTNTFLSGCMFAICDGMNQKLKWKFVLKNVGLIA